MLEILVQTVIWKRPDENVSHVKSILNKSPMPAPSNNLRHCQKYSELEILCPIELMWILKIILFMFFVAQYKGAQHGLKWQCFLVLTDMKKIQKVLPRSSNKDFLVSIALKHCLSYKSAFCTQFTWSPVVILYEKKLKETNPCFKYVITDNQRQEVIKEPDPTLGFIN